MPGTYVVKDIWKQNSAIVIRRGEQGSRPPPGATVIPWQATIEIPLRASFSPMWIEDLIEGLRIEDKEKLRGFCYSRRMRVQC